MHAAKQAILTRNHEPESETTVYFMDVRAHGKGFDDFIERARDQHGVRYRRSMISQVYLNPENDNLIIETFDHHLNRKMEEDYDMVVLSSGFKPAEGSSELVKNLGILTNPYGFVATEFDNPVSTSIQGIYACGGIETPKDIPETVMQAGAAAAEASILLSKARDTETVSEAVVEEKPIDPIPRVGVFVCHCGTNIAGVVNIRSVVDELRALPHVAYVNDFMFTCSTDTQERMVEAIQENHLNRVVVAACSPRTHESLFQETLRKAGLNPYLFEMASIREQCSWVHPQDPDGATEKAKDLIRASVARSVHLAPLKDSAYAVFNEALVVGGGVAGMAAALTMADQGFHVHLVEKDDELGGFARKLSETLEGNNPRKLVRYLEERAYNHPKITLYLKSRLTVHGGHVGAFRGTIEGEEGLREIRYGALVVATGGEAYQPHEYLYGTDDRVLTQVELSERLLKDSAWARRIKRVVMIQCVGSRNEEFPVCSRVCCSAAVKNSIKLREINPEAQVTVLYRDVRTFGFKELYYMKARQQGVVFFRYVPEERPEVFTERGKMIVHFTDRSSHRPFQIEPDLVVLSAGIRPNRSADQVAQLLKLPRTQEGFFLEAHVKLRPLDFPSPGIFLAGLAHSPRFIEETLTMAKSVGQQAAKILCKKEVSTSAAVAEVDPEKCAACLICVKTCPFSAPFINGEGVSQIAPSECEGCGICVAECPARAITLKHTTDEQLLAKIDALLES
jgi:heterodisulfide reductase subunit A-like polyferredoxin